MKTFLTLFALIIILFVAHAHAANTPPPCTSGALITNGGNGQYGCNYVGSGLSVVTSGGALYLTATGGTPSDSITTETGDPWVEENGTEYIVTE